MFLKTNRWHKDKSVPSIFQPEQLLRQHKFLDEAWAIRVWWGWFWLKTNPRRMLWAQGLSRKFRKYSSNYKRLELVLKLSFQFLKAFINEVNSPQKKHFTVFAPHSAIFWAKGPPHFWWYLAILCQRSSFARMEKAAFPISTTTSPSCFLCGSASFRLLAPSWRSETGFGHCSWDICFPFPTSLTRSITLQNAAALVLFRDVLPRCRGERSFWAPIPHQSVLMPFSPLSQTGCWSQNAA